MTEQEELLPEEPIDKNRIKAIIESILFASTEPLSHNKILSVLKDDFPITKKDITAFIIELKEDYDKTERGFKIFSVAEGYILKTNSKYAKWVKKIVKTNLNNEKLSKPALETLAIIAYKQPISRAEIESIRGVNIDGTMKVLLDKGLIFVSGRKEIPGKPLLYSTTKVFLNVFGLKSIEELPTLGELSLNSK